VPQNIYEDPDFFEAYSAFKRSREGLAGAPEWPTLRGLLPPLTGRRVLDLGCGFGAFARWARENGAAAVLGIDLSQKMLLRARELTRDPAVTYLEQSIDSLAFAQGAFDLVYSSLALHYLPDFESVCRDVRRVSVPGAWFVFSVEHPLYTAPSAPGWQTLPDVGTIWPLNDYLREGKRLTNWLVPGVEKYHRTIETYVNGLLDHGFRLARLIEWGPNDEQIAENPEWRDELHRPPFLLMSAQALN
jgi:SAM-dependent methyltransferase